MKTQYFPEDLEEGLSDSESPVFRGKSAEVLKQMGEYPFFFQPHCTKVRFLAKKLSCVLLNSNSAFPVRGRCSTQFREEGKRGEKRLMVGAGVKMFFYYVLLVLYDIVGICGFLMVIVFSDADYLQYLFSLFFSDADYLQYLFSLSTFIAKQAIHRNEIEKKRIEERRDHFYLLKGNYNELQFGKMEAGEEILNHDVKREAILKACVLKSLGVEVFQKRKMKQIYLNLQESVRKRQEKL